MAGVLQHLRSSTLNKRPNPASMVDGQVAINYASGAPGMFFKDSNGALVKVGPVHVGSGAPNAVPASGGTAGNSIGEQWLDTSGGTYVFKIWDGSAWRSEAGEFVNVTGDTMTGALGIIAGSAASPSLFISGDADTGLYSPGANQLAISTNGTGRLFVDASGNVGVGTSSPIALYRSLSIHGNATDQGGVLDLATSNQSSRAYVFNDSNGLSLQTATTHPILIKTDSVERLRITSTGAMNFVGAGTAGSTQAVSFNGSAPVNSLVIDSTGKVGLGTSSAGDILHVKGGSTYAGVIADNSATTGGGAFRAYRNGVQKAIFCVDSWVTGTSSDDAAIYADAGGGIKFYTNNSSTAKAVLTSGGSLGIGVNAPDPGGQGLHVHNASAADSSVRITNSTTGATNGDGFAIQVASDGTARLRQFENVALTFETNATERGRWDSSGRFLVGTSTNSYANSKVEVFGGLLASSEIASRIYTLNNVSSANPTTVNGSGFNSVPVRVGDVIGFPFGQTRTVTAVVSDTQLTVNSAWSTSFAGSNVTGYPSLVFSVTADGASSPTEAMRIKNSRIINIANTPVYADNAAAKTGGLVDGDVYRTSTGDLKIVYT